MDETAGNTRNEELVVNEELHDRVELLLALLEHRVEHRRLGHRAREAVENEPKSEQTGRQRKVAIARERMTSMTRRAIDRVRRTRGHRERVVPLTRLGRAARHVAQGVDAG